MIEYDEAEANKTDRAYQTPDVTRQRMRTLEALQLKAEELVLDVGCGSGLLAHVKKSKAENLPEDAESYDAVACVQVLLYVPGVSAVLSEMHRILKPGGRVAIVETDWRGTVLNSHDDSLTRKMLAAWDDAVPSPNLPARLGPLLAAQGFSAISVDAFPILNTSYTPGSWSLEMLDQFVDCAREQGTVSAAESEAWLDDLRHKGADGAYFFCVNRFVFTAVKI
jgi:ubiquinone/menaquinone biosynthesis C-methylase UbiE